MRVGFITAVLVAFFVVLSCCVLMLCMGAGVVVVSARPGLQDMLAEWGPQATPVPIITRKLPSTEERSTENLLAQTEVPERDLVDIVMRLKNPAEPVQRIVRDAPPDYQIGAQEVFWISDQNANRNFTAEATLRYATPHLYMWVENGYDVDEEGLKQSADSFENHTYPTNHSFFGREWSPGIDGDVHIHIFNGHVPGVGGYFSSSDEYPRAVNPYSNEREMFYINLEGLKPGNEYYDSILAHEFQHMIHWKIDKNEDTWVNEGLSELASRLNGYDPGGSEWSFQSRPDTQLTAWADTPGSAAPNYGGSYLFMVYFLQRFGEDTLRQMVANQANGADGFNQALAERGSGLTFEDVFADWLIANYLDDTELGSEERFGYQDMEVQVTLDHSHSGYPDSRATTVHQYAADYIELTNIPDELSVEFSGSTTVKLADTEPYSGRYMWWSNRGDESDMTMTRAFDLSGLERATLQARLWYDIEKDWDYAYIEASTDGGQTWDTLQGQYTTDANPTGNNFGQGYTGMSGHPTARAVRGQGGTLDTGPWLPVPDTLNQEQMPQKPQWIPEEIDLTPYAGRQIMLRFEYITDDAVNHPSLFVDDIAIPELGYLYDAETDDGGWEGQGFIRTNNVLPQRFLVQLIEFGSEIETSLQRMELNEVNQGQLLVRGGTQQAVLVISGLALVTTELAGYEYAIKPVEK